MARRCSSPVQPSVIRIASSNAGHDHGGCTSTGPLVEAGNFPERTNVQFLTVRDRANIGIGYGNAAPGTAGIRVQLQCGCCGWRTVLDWSIPM